MMYGAISGSAPGTTAAVGAMCFPILVRLGYEPTFSAAIIVGVGCILMIMVYAYIYCLCHGNGD